MPSPEYRLREEQKEQLLESWRQVAVAMAKPGIPQEKPRRRDIPDIPDPMPRELPESVPEHVEPVRTGGNLPQ